VYNLFLDRQRTIFIHRNISTHRYIGCIHEIEIQIFSLIGQKKGLDTADKWKTWTRGLLCFCPHWSPGIELYMTDIEQTKLENMKM